MQTFIEAIAPGLRYVMLAVIVYIVVRLLIAMFTKKTSDPIRGKLVSTVTGESITLYDREVSVGRNKKCDIVLPFETISRLHAVIAYRTKGFVIFDTISKSGVSVNGQRIKGRKLIRHGDVVSIGGMEYTLHEPEKYKYIKDKSGAPGRPSYGLILILLTVFNLSAMLLNMYHDGEFDGTISVVCLVFVALQWVYYFLATYILRLINFELEMIALLFASVGLAITGSIHPGAVLKQTICIVIGVIGYVALTRVLLYVEATKPMRWFAAAASIGALGVTLLIAEDINGALNWISFGGISVQPSEFVKVAFVFAGAATLEKLQSVRSLTMYIAFAGVCIAELFVMRDFGTALVFFFTFIVIAFMRSGDVRTLLLICVVAALGAVLIIFLKPYVADRFSAYGHVWEQINEGGFQQTRTLIYSASGGLLGLGLGNGALRHIFAAAEDLVFGVVCEEFGLIVGFLIPVTYCFIAVWAVINAKKAKSVFHVIAGVAACAMMLFQSMLSIFGITDLLPLTGVTLPFVSKGGSSIISCFLLLSFVKTLDSRTYSSFKPKLLRRRAEQGDEYAQRGSAEVNKYAPRGSGQKTSQKSSGAKPAPTKKSVSQASGTASSRTNRSGGQAAGQRPRSASPKQSADISIRTNKNSAGVRTTRPKPAAKKNSGEKGGGAR